MSLTTVIPRPLRGSRIDVFYPIKAENVPSLSSLDSAFQLQEYISLVIRLDVHDVDRIVSIPAKEGDSKVTVDESCWIYEQLRRLAQDLTHPLITNLQNECTRQTCPQMKAGEWLYLCVAHGNDGGMEQCCAIDYILHTIDSATALLNSPRAFPSRLSIPAPSYRHFASLARRLGRIFAHAYFQHRALFEQAEAESSLYRRFEEIVARWNLVPTEFLVIPTKEDVQVGRGEPKLAAAGVEISILSDHDNNNVSPPSEDETKSPRSGSPGRRFGRSRTDTMVFSEASALVEELAKSPIVQAELEPQVQEPDLDLEDDAIEDEPVFTSVDELDKEMPPPVQVQGSVLEDSSELPIVSPSSSTALFDHAPQDVRVVALDESPAEVEHLAETTPLPEEPSSTPPLEEPSAELPMESLPVTPPLEEPSATLSSQELVISAEQDDSPVPIEVQAAEVEKVAEPETSLSDTELAVEHLAPATESEPNLESVIMEAEEPAKAEVEVEVEVEVEDTPPSVEAPITESINTSDSSNAVDVAAETDETPSDGLQAEEDEEAEEEAEEDAADGSQEAIAQT
ncbi:Mob1/phocein [Rhodocollybia butyracea]|uniref:Mob1/phocein n=1 Tax=Rhodocollybia butyracea TaxID=206335 RepID=A0A9P5PUZ6_9AGAR|nr:Mob1/phocein [Rhodocollybia butyracea]